MPFSQSPWGPWWLSGFNPGPWHPWQALGSFANLSFEIAGSSPGEAEDWTTASLSSAFELAGYGSPEHEEEGFEDAWDNDAYLTALEDGELALYLFKATSAQFEGFESRWDNDSYQRALNSSDLAIYSGNGEDGFEDAWDNDAYLTALGATAVGTPDTFESDWDNDAYQTEFVGFPTDLSAPATYDGQNFEDFEEVQRDQQWTTTGTTDTATCVGHGFSAGDPVTVYSTIQLPGGVNPDTQYYVRSPTADTFKLTITPGGGGSSILFETTGLGAHFIKADPAAYWTTDDEDV